MSPFFIVIPFRQTSPIETKKKLPNTEQLFFYNMCENYY